MNWFHRWLTINGRVIIWCLAFILFFDLAIRTSEGIWLDLDVQRLPADDPATMAKWKQQLIREAEFKVLFIGDSVVFGGGVKNAASSLPAGFARELKRAYPLKKLKVVNCSLPGNTPADAWVISRYLADTDPDLVIYDANLGWFGNQRVLEHPGLTKLPGVNLTLEDWQRLHAVPPGPRGVEAQLAQIIAGGWALYRDRVFLNYWCLGAPMSEKIKQTFKYRSLSLLLPHRQNQEQQEQLAPWYQKDTTNLRNSKGVLGNVVLEMNNPQWYYYQQLLREWQQRGTVVVIFAVPRNQVLLSQYQVINQQHFYPNQSRLLNTAREEGAVVFDYTQGVVDNREFTDTVHPTAQGNQQLSYRLYQDVAAAGLLQPLAAKEP